MLWHSLESQTSINSNTFRLQTSLIITACCFVISFQNIQVILDFSVRRAVAVQRSFSNPSVLDDGFTQDSRAYSSFWKVF